MSLGRVLIVGSRADALAKRFALRGFECVVGSAKSINAFRPEVVVVRHSPRSASHVAQLREEPALKDVPVVLEGKTDKGALDVDGAARGFDALEKLVLASIRGRQVASLEALVRRRLELLLELSSADEARTLEALTQLVRERLAAALLADAAHVVTSFVDPAWGRLAQRASELGRGLEAEGAWILPILDVGHAIVVVRQRSLEQEERDFVAAVAVAWGHAVNRYAMASRDAQLRGQLERAYIERYHELLDSNDRLRALDRKKNELLAVLTHDLRAPLNVLLGHSHILLTDDELPPVLKPSANAIQRTSKKVLELVEDLLEKSREEDGRIVLFTKAFDVAETCQDAVAELQILAKAQGLKLRVEAPMSLIVLGDEQKIGQVLQNLITNALKHSTKATEVVLRARLKSRPDGDVALVEVADDGEVADPNALLLAFDRSQGLGLAICRDYVERHGGEIWAEGGKPRGATFTFTLPIKTERAAPSATPRTDVPLVLIADADPVFVRSCTMALSGHYRVEVAHDGDEAVRKAKALVPDLMLMDVFMPRRDGLDALRELMQSPETSSVPVLLVSGKAELTEKLKAHPLGAVGVLTKPFPLAVLLTRVGETLRRSSRGGRGLGTDPVTGLLDHVGVLNRLQEELSRSARYTRPMTLVSLKPTGEVPARLGPLAATLRQTLRTPDVVGHVGQGVFILMLPETPLASCGALVQRLGSLLEAAGMSYLVRTIDVRESGTSAEAVLEQLLR